MIASKCPDVHQDVAVKQTEHDRCTSCTKSDKLRKLAPSKFFTFIQFEALFYLIRQRTVLSKLKNANTENFISINIKEGVVIY